MNGEVQEWTLTHEMQEITTVLNNTFETLQMAQVQVDGRPTEVNEQCAKAPDPIGIYELVGKIHCLTIDVRDAAEKLKQSLK